MKGQQVTAYLTNHTYGRLCMRPWGYTNHPSPDSDFQEDLGAQMCDYTGYSNQIGLSLYPTAGTSRDWSYGALRTIVYTFEHGSVFHPAYGANIPSTYALNRPAWLLLAEAGGRRRFACVTHSTGGPVVREWLDRHYVRTGKLDDCPLGHLVMLAPANVDVALRSVVIRSG